MYNADQCVDNLDSHVKFQGIVSNYKGFIEIMILRAKHSAGYLDISSLEQIDGEKGTFRLTLKPGQTVTIDDKWRSLANISNAIKSGLLEVVSYDLSDGSVLVHEEFEQLLGR